MSKEDMITYFDTSAIEWEKHITRRKMLVAEITLEKTGIQEGMDVLDVGAGTGMLVPLLEKRKVKTYTGIELSKEMINVFKRKHPGRKILYMDFEEELIIRDRYDAVVIFDTFPLFTEKEQVFINASSVLRSGGNLIISNERSRQFLSTWRKRNGLHGNGPSLPDDDELSELCSRSGLSIRGIDDEDFFLFHAQKGVDG